MPAALRDLIHRPQGFKRRVHDERCIDSYRGRQRDRRWAGAALRPDRPGDRHRDPVLGVQDRQEKGLPHLARSRACLLPRPDRHPHPLPPAGQDPRSAGSLRCRLHAVCTALGARPRTSAVAGLGDPGDAAPVGDSVCSATGRSGRAPGAARSSRVRGRVAGARGRGAIGARGRGAIGSRGRGAIGSRGRGAIGSRGRGAIGARGRGATGTSSDAACSGSRSCTSGSCSS